TNQLNNLETVDLQALKTNQVAALTTNQLVSMPTAQLNILTTDQVAALTTGQVVGLSTNQLNNLETVDLQALKTSQIVALTTNQLANLLTAQLNALATAQVAALTTGQVASLSTNQVSNLETVDLIALTSSQIAALTTTQISLGLTTAQIEVLTSTQVCALTSNQIAALTTDQIPHVPFQYTPIILDLNGDGINTLNISSGVQFDLNATGQKISTGWVGQGDGLLVMDRNHDGVINDGGELFGSATDLGDGQKAVNGYEALRPLDTNGDGVISNADEGFADLKVWDDGNADGVSQAAELKTLASLGIASLDLTASPSSEINNGNWVGLTSGYVKVDGTSHDMADVWFITNESNTANPAEQTTVVGVEQGLRTKVTDLAQAISSFDDSQFSLTNNNVSSMASILSSQASVSESQVAAVNVGGMVDTLKQFDANGNLIVNSVQTPNLLQTGVNGPSLVNAQDPDKNGFLAS
ncbi:MAG: hypothetical protein NTY50_16795, partial [Methylobacter sp.]|nr:hypothetical protein [Methylobacter sp.]